MLKVKKNTDYRIKTKSKYFKDKYGEASPIIRIEDDDHTVFGGSWGEQQGNPACLIFAMRTVSDDLDMENPWAPKQVYYGKINGMGECVHISELEEIK